MNSIKSIGVGLGAIMVAVPTLAMAAECPAGFPSENITMKVGYDAGGGTDIAARQVAAGLEQMNGWTVVVENKPGAAGAVMATGLMREAGDGLTIGVGTSTTIAITPHEKPDIIYTYEDFRYPATVMALNYALVATADKPYHNLQEFIDWAKQNGGATVSVGSISYELTVQEIAKHYGVNLTPIPSGGSSAALKDALGGHVDATVQGTAHVKQIEAGKMVQLATLTTERATYAPDAMTLKENGMDFALDGHVVIILPKDTPDDVFNCLAGAIAAVTSSEPYGKLMDDLISRASNLGPEGAMDFLSDASAFYKVALVK